MMKINNYELDINTKDFSKIIDKKVRPEIVPAKNELLNNYYCTIIDYCTIVRHSLENRIVTHLIVYETCFMTELFLKYYLLSKGLMMESNIWNHNLEQLIENAKKFDNTNFYELDAYKNILLKLLGNRIELRQYANARYNHFTKCEKLFYDNENKEKMIKYSEEVLAWIKRNLFIE